MYRRAGRREGEVQGHRRRLGHRLRRAHPQGITSSEGHSISATRAIHTLLEHAFSLQFYIFG